MFLWQEQNAVVSIDIVWVGICAALVFLMQAGFACLETGLTRSKNNINVAAKNLADFCIAFVIFGLLGYGLMYGVSVNGWVGGDKFAFSALDTPQQHIFFLYQAMFAATSCTIISGAVAERLRFSAYVLVTLLVAGLIYPLVGHWAWQEGGWLNMRGFYDMAGATVVHSTGASVALALLLILGAREGRFITVAGVRSSAIRASNMPLSVVGCLLLMLGWIGFNGGAKLGMTEAVPVILTHSFIAGTVGGCVALLLQYARSRNFDVLAMINGTLAGLVSITACADVVTPLQAAGLGVLAAGAMLLTTRLLEMLRIDDAVGAVPVHLSPAILGTLAVGLIGNDEHSLETQLYGILAINLFAFTTALIIFKLVDMMLPLRISPVAELLGMNVSEHKEKTELFDVLMVMNEQARSKNLSARAPAEPYTEGGIVAHYYNQVVSALEQSFNDIERKKEEAEAGNLAKAQFLQTMSHELRTPLNGIIGAMDILHQNLESHAENLRYIKLAQASSETLLAAFSDILNYAQLDARTDNLPVEPFNLAELLEEMLPPFKQRAFAQRLLFNVTIDSRAPKFIIGARAMLSLALEKLLDNALKFTEEGRVELRAEVADVSADTVTLQFTVKDTGSGIAPERQQHIFDAFTQADSSTTRMHEGLGLGLAIVRKIVRAQGGKIHFESVPGEGTECSFTLTFGRVKT